MALVALLFWKMFPIARPRGLIGNTHNIILKLVSRCKGLNTASGAVDSYDECMYVSVLSTYQAFEEQSGLKS